MSVSYATIESEIISEEPSCQDILGKANEQLASLLSDNTIHPVIAICDGPCQSALPSNKLITLGRCEHYLCFSCFGKVLNTDGSFGCNSSYCYYQDETSTIITTYANDYTSIDGSTCSAENDYDDYPGQNEMVVVKLVLIERNPYNATLRVHNEIEVPSRLNTREIIEILLEDKKRDSKTLLKVGKLYYLHGGSGRLRKLKDFASLNLFDIPQVKNSVFFVLDTIGHLNNQPVKISFE